MTIAARYLDGKTSASQEVRLDLLTTGQLRIVDGLAGREFALTDLRISPRIGNTQRRIQLPDGGTLELRDNDALDHWLAQHGARTAHHMVFGLERRWPVAVAALAIVILGTLAFIRYGVPALASRVAYAIPVAVDQRLGSDTLELLDGRLLQPTTLPKEHQAEIASQFKRIVAGLPDASRYRLEFRKGGRAGANAFALPSGIVVITDELVASSEHPEEIIAVLAHEVGHVVHRHSLRMLLQSSASAAVLFVLLGDVTSISSLAAGLPALLTQASYSREFETEADRYSLAWLREHRIATHYFRDILLRLEKKEGSAGQSGVISYFSSHPDSSERGLD